MSLVMRVEFPGLDADTFQALAQNARHHGLAVWQDREALVLTEAHDALTDQADWNAKVWSMHPEALSRLEHDVKELYDLSQNGIIVQAIWAGDEVSETIALSIDEFSTVLQRSQLGTHTRYKVLKR